VRRRPNGGSGTGHDEIKQAELMKLQKNGQFPDKKGCDYLLLREKARSKEKTYI
jgi:hypothetical protein